MAKNELTTTNTTTLASKELEKHVLNIQTAIKNGNINAWVIASEYVTILADECFDEDFEKIEDFADYMGVSKSYITQCNKACEFVANNEDFTGNDITVGKAYMLSTLKETYIDFKNWCIANGFDFYSIPDVSDKVLKGWIKQFKDELKAVDVTTEESATEPEDVSRETNEEETIAIIDYDGHTYMIPIEVLEKYRVAE